MSQLKIVDRGTVFSGEFGTDRQSCTFPGVCVLSDGSWVCTFRAAPMKAALADQKVLVTWTENDGGKWSSPATPFVPPSRNGKVGSFRTGYLTETSGGFLLSILCWVDQSSPNLPFFNEKTEGLLDTRICISQSTDKGSTWSEPEFIDTHPFECPTPITGPLLEVGKNLVACQFELNKGYEDSKPWLHKSILLFSSDRGKSWSHHSVVSEDPKGKLFYWDQRPGVLMDGRILELFWTFDRENEIYRNIHARQSTDNGSAWSDIWDTGIPGQPAAPVSLRDGSVAMVYVDRTGPPTIKVRVSQDGGHTWEMGLEVILWETQVAAGGLNRTTMNEAWTEMSDFAVGLPSTAPLANGDVLVVFYAGDETDFTSIHWVRLAPVL